MRETFAALRLEEKRWLRDSQDWAAQLLDLMPNLLVGILRSAQDDIVRVGEGGSSLIWGGVVTAMCGQMTEN